mmetsp:Transcript_35792/g.107609  ORF Transcript_35792/g.107609 Transcript_35792/m.107609 type:complete len:266 (-) Transcript_35792:84-881(-)
MAPSTVCAVWQCFELVFHSWTCVSSASSPPGSSPSTRWSRRAAPSSALPMAVTICSSLKRCPMAMARRAASRSLPCTIMLLRSCVLTMRSSSSLCLAASSSSVVSRQIAMEPSWPPVTAVPSSADISRAQIRPSCASIVATFSSDLMVQSLSRPSEEAEASWTPRHRKATCSTDESWPSNVLRQLKVAMAHSRTVASPDAVATTWSTGENLAAHTPRRWPLRVPTTSPVSACHTLASRSPPAVTTSLWFGETSSALTSLSCAFRV